MHDSQVDQIGLIDGQVDQKDGQISLNYGQINQKDGQIGLNDGQIDQIDMQIGLNDGQIDHTDGQIGLDDGHVYMRKLFTQGNYLHEECDSFKTLEKFFCKLYGEDVTAVSLARYRLFCRISYKKSMLSSSSTQKSAPTSYECPFTCWLWMEFKRT